MGYAGYEGRRVEPSPWLPEHLELFDLRGSGAEALRVLLMQGLRKAEGRLRRSPRRELIGPSEWAGLLNSAKNAPAGDRWRDVVVWIEAAPSSAAPPAPLRNPVPFHVAASQLLCRIASGGGFGERALYTNGEEYTFFAQNPVLMNGIPSLLARGDLADRAIAITLPPIPDDRRKPEAEVWREFEAAQPGLLGMLLDGLACALRRLPGLHLERLPRMADFARLAVAMAPAFGWSEADMPGALEENRAASVVGVIESDGIAVAVQAITEERSRWLCTASELLSAINERTSLDRQRQRDWPKDATRLSQKLRRVAPALRRIGIEVVLPASGGRAGRTITLEKRELTPPPAGAPSQPAGTPWEAEL